MSNLVDQFHKLNHETVQLFEAARVVQQETGKLPPELEKEIASVSRDREQLLTELGSWWLNTKAKYEGKKAEYDAILKAIDYELDDLLGRMDFIKDIIRQVLPPGAHQQVVNESVYIHQTPSERLVIDGAIEDVPVELTRVAIEVDAKKTIEQIKAGKQFDWAHLETKWNPQIKPGGERAARNAKARLTRNAETKSPITTLEHGAQGADVPVTTQGKVSATEVV